MKKAIFFFFTFLISVTAYAADPVSTVQGKYNKITDLQADFIQTTYIELLGKNVSSPGLLMMKRPDKIKIEYTGENPKQYISNGKKLWVIDIALNQVEEYSAKKDIPKEALSFLNGFDNMEELFLVSEWKKSSKAAGNIYLTLKPKSKNSQYRSLDCEFSPDGLLKAMTIHNNSGNISKYVFNNIKLNVGLDDKLFKK